MTTIKMQNKHPMGCEAQLTWKCFFTPTFYGGHFWTLTCKAGQTDLVFGMRSGLTSTGRSVYAGLQVSAWFVSPWLTSRHPSIHTDSILTCLYEKLSQLSRKLSKHVFLFWCLWTLSLSYMRSLWVVFPANHLAIIPTNQTYNNQDKHQKIPNNQEMEWPILTTPELA